VLGDGISSSRRGEAKPSPLGLARLAMSLPAFVREGRASGYCHQQGPSKKKRDLEKCRDCANAGSS